MDPKVAIILVNYNTYEDTCECVKSLENIDYSNYEIYIIDNNSGDVNALKTNVFLNNMCKIIYANENGGFSYGNNIGIKQAIIDNADYVLLLNNDTVVKSDFLTRMVCTAKEEHCGMVSGRICYYSDKNKINYRGGYFNRSTGFCGYYPTNDYDVNDSLRKYISFATGCVLLIPVSTIKKIGYLDENYFMYGEDVEYSCRVNDNKMKIIYCDDSIVYHKISASVGENSPFNQYYITRNDLYNILKFGRKKKYAIILHFTRNFIDIIKGRASVKPVLYAWKDFFCGKTGRSRLY